MTRVFNTVIDRVGQKHGMLTVLRRAINDRHGHTRWLCRCECGKEAVVGAQPLQSGKAKSCGCLRAISARKRVGKNHPSWKGGRYAGPGGYVAINVGPRKTRFEHVLAMEKLLGRPLKAGETVHHKNGIRTDNRLDNLELWACNHSKGQRIEDLIDWAVSLLKQYKPEVLTHE